MARHVSNTTATRGRSTLRPGLAPSQRGSNENVNGLRRRYFPKGTNLATWSQEHLRAIEEEIDARACLVIDSAVRMACSLPCSPLWTAHCSDMERIRPRTPRMKPLTRN